MTSDGVFLSLDGVDGAGKTTQTRLLADWLRGQGRAVTVCRDPGGTPVGDRIRQIILDPDSDMGATTELFLYMASRSVLVEQVIRPALDRGHVVIVDRFVLSTVVYQGHAGGQSLDTIRQLGMIATGGLLPRLSVVLDVPVEVALARKAGPDDRMEAKGRGFLEAVRRGFQVEAEASTAIVLVDGTDSVAAVHAAIRREVQRVLEPTSRP
jgi:dTMP kinase